MKCPKCGYDYRPDVFKCPDCDVWLNSREPADQEPGQVSEGEPEYQNLVVVFKSSNYNQTLIAESMLDAAGVDYYAQGDSMLGFALERRILVRQNDLAAAQEALKDLEADESSYELPADQPVPEDETKEPPKPGEPVEPEK